MVVNCYTCKNDFNPKFFASTRATPKYCTRLCMAKSFTIPAIKKTCKSCGNEFLWKNKSHRTYCSVRCMPGNPGALIEYRNNNPRISFWKSATQEQKNIKYVELFEKHVVRKDGCWGWKSFIDSTGSGRIGPNGYMLLAYRASWLIHKGEIPKDKCVLHKCDNRICTNPDHLYIGTHKDNTRDKIERNRGNFCKQRSKNAKLTFAQAKEIKQLLKLGHSYGKLAQRYNVKPGTIQNIKELRTWKDA